MDVLAFREKISEYRKEKHSFLNDTYLWVNMAIDAIQGLPRSDFKFEVPSTKAGIKQRAVRRGNAEEVINRIITKDIYNSAYVMIISSVEDYFNKIMKLILTYDNNRIKFVIPGASMQSNISIIEFLDTDKEKMIEKIVEQRINTLFYASPKKQLEYFSNALGINISEQTWYLWIEYKARRDVIVHNASVINEVYMEKVNGYGKFLLKDEIIFNKDEFSTIIANLKSIVGEIDVIVRKEYHVPTSKQVRRG